MPLLTLTEAIQQRDDLLAILRDIFGDGKMSQSETLEALEKYETKECTTTELEDK